MKNIMLSLILVFMLFSCSDNSIGPVKPTKDIDELISNAGELLIQPQTFLKVNLGSKVENRIENGYNYISQSQNIKLSNKFDEIIAFNSAYADVLYPGAIIQGKDILEGKLTSIGDFPREPITLTLQSGASQKIDNPTLSTVTNGINEILKKPNTLPAQMFYSTTELFDSQQAFLELGLDFNWLVGSLNGKFQKEKSVTKKSMFLYFKQIYYTISVNSFSSSSDYFSSSVNVEQLKQKIYPGNPPCYISSVSYGRMIIVKMTSEESYESMKTAIDGSIGIIGGKAEFNDNDILNNSTFEAIIVGGSSIGAAEAITSGDINKINELIQKEAQFSSDNPGFPISYTVRYLNGGSPVKLGKTTEYWMQDWKIDDSQFQEFDFYLSQFKIIDDGNSFTDGNFYYTIKILDKNGNLLKDANGNDAIIETTRLSSIKAGTGELINITNGVISGVTLMKQIGEQFTIDVTLFDKFSSGNDVQAGYQGDIYIYPWNYKFNDFITMDLVKSTGTYQTQFIYKVVKK